MIDRSKVQTFRVGRVRRVWLSQIRDAWPETFEGVVARRQLARELERQLRA